MQRILKLVVGLAVSALAAVAQAGAIGGPIATFDQAEALGTSEYRVVFLGGSTAHVAVHSVGGAQMIRHGQKGYFVGGKAVAQGEREIKMYWSAAERSLSLDGRPVRKLTDYLGVLRTVVFCTEDLQLVKGTARIRRRFLDLLLSQTTPVYLPLLQRYAQALRSRNALLKRLQSGSAKEP